MLSSQTWRHEIKSELAVEAARDPDSKFSAEDAERVLLDESEKAGVPAFKFDPNASVDEKAAQAAARNNPLHTNRPHAAGVVSDLNAGPADYDLPPPTTAGALPPPTDAGKAKLEGTHPEEDQWKKAGWVPRFGDGQTEEDKKENEKTLIDHQTFLETQIDEKFYGDWYHNAAIIVFACFSTYFTTICGGGIGWMIIILAACGTYYRTSIRRTRRNFRDDITREMAKNGLEKDHETLEWMNHFMTKFWPILAPNIATGVIASVDQVLSTTTPAFLDSMRMDYFNLGTKPPRMEHVKTYLKKEDDIVQMDWKFSFTPNDTLDMTEREKQTKMNPKLVLEIRVGKAMLSKALKVIVEDFSFSGIMRLKMKLQLGFPYIEKVDMCFLEPPEIDYVCKPLGGETFGFDINFIPGLETFIKSQIHANLGPMMYDPNVFPIEIAKILSGSPADQAIGVVAITIHGADGLRNPDKLAGSPDPYTVVSLNSRTELGRTKTVHENANPKWHETIYVIITSFTDVLTMQVFDYNEFRKDKELGTASFALEKLQTEPEHINEQFEVLANARNRGVINADIKFFPVLESIKTPDGKSLPPPESNQGIATITIEQAKELDNTKSMVGALNPYGVLTLNGKEVHITKKLKRTNNPVFPSPTTSILVTDRRKARIGVVVKDDRDLQTDIILGQYQIKLDDMLNLMSKGQEWYNLAGTKTGRVKLTCNWKPVALTGVTGSGGYVTPIGVLRVHFKAAHQLRNLETLGKSDPYARVLLNGVQKGRTVTFKNNLEPMWDEVLYVPIHTMRERITFEVMDEEHLAKDRSLGQIEIPLAEYVREDEENGGYLVHDTKRELTGGLQMQGKGTIKGQLVYTVSFFPTLNVIDPEEEKADQEAAAAAGMPTTPQSPTFLDAPTSPVRKSLDVARPQNNVISTHEANGSPLVQTETAASSISRATSTKGSFIKKKAPKIRVTAEDLPQYQCGLVVFNILEGTFAHSNMYLEIVMDDQAFASYTTSKAKTRTYTFGEMGDAFVRELDFSQMTLRLVEKLDERGEDEDRRFIAKLTGKTLPTLEHSLYTPHELTLRGEDGSMNKVTVNLKYLPVQMTLDPSESISNSGNLRVEILDAQNLPAADRNGFSDPYVKIKLNDKEVFKTKTQKKTLNPVWNEAFEIPIPSRTAASFRVDVYDWDFADSADYLGGVNLNLADIEPFTPKQWVANLDGKSGSVRLRTVFRPAYITRARQGTSTFNNTFAPAAKVAAAPVKGVEKLGGGVVKGASFLRRGFSRKDSKGQETFVPVGQNDEFTGSELTTPGTPTPGLMVSDANGSITPIASHNRQTSMASQMTTPQGTGTTSEAGTATFTILSALGYPDKADVQVHINMKSAKGKEKELYKTKPVKSQQGMVQYSDSETFRTSCNADTTFQIVVKDHELLRSKELGEAVFFVSDQGSGGEQTVRAGAGSILLRSSFAPDHTIIADNNSLRPDTSHGVDGNSPISKKEGRRSFFSKRDASNSGGLERN